MLHLLTLFIHRCLESELLEAAKVRVGREEERTLTSVMSRFMAFCIINIFIRVESWKDMCPFNNKVNNSYCALLPFASTRSKTPVTSNCRFSRKDWFTPNVCICICVSGGCNIPIYFIQMQTSRASTTFENTNPDIT